MADGWGTDAGGWGTSTDTPNDVGGDSNNNEAKKSGGSGCRKCGEDGHFARECPNAGDGDKKPDVCRKCGEEGHFAKDCEKPDMCRRCGEEGHMVRDCPEPEKTRVRENEDGTKTEIYVPTETKEDDLFKSGIGSGINFDKFEKIPVKCTGENVPKPVASFADSGLRKLLLENVEKSGYKKPTPIQKHAIPIVMGGRDLMGCAQTGSGKTAAFLLPILNWILENGETSSMGDCPQTPRAVIVAPTRELAIQIKDEGRKFASGSVVKAVVCYGGTSTGFQINTIMRGCDVLIATPGRLMDLVEKGKVSFEKVKFLVLDEADRMLDMGFMPEVRRIVEAAGMPAKGDRQTLMFSATFQSDVQHEAKTFLNDYIFLAVGMVGGASSDVVQKFYEVEKFSKRDKLTEILKDAGKDRTLVFVETKRNADFLATYLCHEGLPTTSIHGDRLQREREEALGDFKAGRMTILVATAVAARGLDIKDVAHVVNYDMPKSVDEYVHRIGRTGRVGNIGKATSFFDQNEDSGIAGELVAILAGSQQEVPSFLQGYGNGEGGGAESGAFGGKDIRKDAPQQEDDWD